MKFGSLKAYKLQTLSLAFLCVFCVLFGTTVAQAKKEAAGTKKDAGKKTSEVKEILSETTHQITINGQRIEYKAIAGTMALTEDTEDAKASMFFIAYTRTNVTDMASRPVTFSFNAVRRNARSQLCFQLQQAHRILDLNQHPSISRRFIPPF